MTFPFQCLYQMACSTGLCIWGFAIDYPYGNVERHTANTIVS